MKSVRIGPPSEVSAGKNGVFYSTHSYPTKIPPEAIVPFIEYFSKPGDLVLDPFCGSGMTGLAAVKLGRNAVLNDISPGAVHLAYNHTTPCNAKELFRSARRVLARMKSFGEVLYGEVCNLCGGHAVRVHTTWAALYRCSSCGVELNLWRCAFEPKIGRISEPFRCPQCSQLWTRRQLQQRGHIPTWAVVSCMECNQRYNRLLDRHEALLLKASPRRVRIPIPNREFSPDREMYLRCALHLQGIEKWSDFYTPRNLSALSLLYQSVRKEKDDRLRSALMLAFTNTAWHASRMRRFNAHGGQRPLTGTLYIPQMSVESNVFLIFEHQVQQIARFFEVLGKPSGKVAVGLGSGTDLSWLPSDSIHYVFTDPPFGSNIFYADCNFVWEAWLGDVTDTTTEIVWNRSRKPESGGKRLADFASLLEDAFRQVARVLKRGAWASIVFHNSDDRVWRVLQDALEVSGLAIRNVSILNKQQWSMKGYKGRRGAEHVTFFDLIVHVRKESRPTAITELNGNSDFVREVLSRHLTSKGIRSRAEQRLTQYLHVVAIRELIERGYRIENASLAEIEHICKQNFRLRGNRWYFS